MIPAKSPRLLYALVVVGLILAVAAPAYYVKLRTRSCDSASCPTDVPVKGGELLWESVSRQLVTATGF